MATHATRREPAEDDADAGTDRPDTAALARRLIAALRGLPTWGHHEVLRERLTDMLARYEQTGDLSEFEHFTESLAMTARLERSPAFLATATAEESPTEPRDILDVIERIEARRDDGRE